MKSEIGEQAADLTFVMSPDVDAATWQAVRFAGLGPMDAQRVLETDDSAERLSLVLSMLDEEAAVLAQRLAGG